ncbi:RhoGAP domain protein [Dictyocaulus viviparus]|uniref:RhoGAP domain protein n=1 Tax=Dictyocaulus viviparus TaxID=29172 RepID=A0A0D8XMH8_DICVI|nr:RhoGAP domain protein [Dictyocaulus viviparus]
MSQSDPQMSTLDRHASSSFTEPEDGFADDDLLAAEDLTMDLSALPQSRSFLERLDYESELGITDPFEEDFSEIASHEIVEVIADGDCVGRPIIVIYAYRLPSNKSIDHAQLLRYLQSVLNKVVDLDYTIIYFHYGLRSHNKPPIKWIFQAYKVLDRRYKKNLKAMYVVHPTRFIRIMWGLFRPFISSKFEEKFHYVNCIRELEDALSLGRLTLPHPIRFHDEQLRSMAGMSSGDSEPQTPSTPPRPTQQFDVNLEFILSHNPDHDTPPIVNYLIEFLTKNALDIEGIFRKSANIKSIRRLQERINKGEEIDFESEPEYHDNLNMACIDASVLLKTFLRSLGEPVTTNALYPRLTALAEVPKKEKTAAVKEIVTMLPRPNYLLLKKIVHFLKLVAANHKINLMTANNLSVVFGPNLTWPTNQQVPIAQLNNLNNFCYRLIVDYDLIFS